MTIDTKANVCSVKFHPTLSYHIAFGTADHHIHYYDLRNLRAPVHIFKGHKKASSYVDFTSPTELVSASTDCTLKLWGINESIVSQNSQCVRTYQGHMNEKNFVGLGTNCTGDFIACGSETNEVFVYHSKLSGPIIRHKFGNSLHAMTVRFFEACVECNLLIHSMHPYTGRRDQGRWSCQICELCLLEALRSSYSPCCQFPRPCQSPWTCLISSSLTQISTLFFYRICSLHQLLSVTSYILYYTSQSSIYYVFLGILDEVANLW